MIDPSNARALAGLASRERDVLGAYQPGFEPESSDVARRPRIVASNDPLSVAAPDGTYFMSAADDGEIGLSRDGGFTLVDGELRTAGGRRVLGFAGPRAPLGPLRVDRYDAALARASDARIDPDGTFSYVRYAIDPRTGERRGERVAAGRLALATLPPGTQPERIDAGHVRAPRGVAQRVGIPGTAGFATLRPYARDLGRVDLIAGLEGLRESYLSYEALRAAGDERTKTDKITMDLLK